VVGALRLRDDELTADEFDGIAIEQATLHEPFVLDARPAARRQRDLHDASP